MQKDPVCGMMVDEKKTKLSSKHDNKTFYFCSASCKTTFDKDPPSIRTRITSRKERA